MCSADADPRLTLAYEESVRAWALQSTVLDELRNRAGVLLSAASVASAFLGAKALEGPRHFSCVSIAAVAVFGVVVLLCVYVVWPAKDWVFVNNGQTLINDYVNTGTSLDDMRKKVTEDNAKHRTKNNEKLNSRFLAFRVACLGLGVDVILWLIDLGIRR